MFSFTLYARDQDIAAKAAAAAVEEITRLDAMLTDYDPDSELMQLSRSPAGQPVAVSRDLFAVLFEAVRIARLSGGALDPTMGTVVRQWRRARRTAALPEEERLKEARSRTGWQQLQFNTANRTVTLLGTNIQLDLGGIAKGYAADRALKVLAEHGIRSALVAASGDIAVGDPPPGETGWRISIGTPFQKQGVDRALLLAHAAVSTSGDSEQSVVIEGTRYSHIVDPRTGLGLTNHLQVTVIAPHATQTDAFATAVSVLGVEAGGKLIKSQPGMSGIICSESQDGYQCLEVNR